MESEQQWAQVNFGNCQLGDKRRTKRMVQVAEQFAANPSASLSTQHEQWGDLKAAYRLLDRKEVTFEAVARPHWELTRSKARRRCLVIGDTTEFDFGSTRQIENIGETGNGYGQGFLLHNALFVQAETEEIIGVGGQTICYRRKGRQKTRKLRTDERMKRDDRESLVWGKVIDDIGAPGEDVEYVHVFDRGADSFEVFCRVLQNDGQWLIRAAKLNRKVLVGPTDESVPLKDYLPQMNVMGGYTLSLRARPGQAARTAEIDVRMGQVKIPRPQHVCDWVRSLNQPPIPMTVIEVVETDAPKGVTPIRWVLYTSLPVNTFDDAWQVIEYYELRWLVEEYHKALKTGCRTEKHQLKTADRLEALVGLTSVVAVRLLQLKSLSRVDPNVPARRVVPAIWLKMLKLARANLNRVHDLTVGQFYFEVAKLGGFIGRKSDGNPGWITIWRGWEKLTMYVYVATKLKNTS